MSSVKTYDSIDTLPQWNWNKVHETGNLAYLDKRDSYRKVDIDHSKNKVDLWDEIYQEFIDEFGLSEGFKESLSQKVSIAKMKNKYIQTKDRIILNFIRVAENRLKEDQKKEGLTLREVVGHIEKFQGVKLNVREITVADYYSYIKIMSKHGKKD